MSAANHGWIEFPIVFSCPVDAIVETRIQEYHGERRGDLIFTKPMLLAIGDRYEEEIARDRAPDAPYR